jgi:soluble lytic murein transglycosylase-like protein
VAALRSIVVAATFLLASPADAQSVDRWSGFIVEASARFGIPEAWIRRVMRAESGGRTLLKGRPITSRAGAMGLMQIMPRTWREMRATNRLGVDPHDPRDNILAGTAYLRAMYDRFGYPGLFAAYNAGPTRFAEHLRSGRRLPAETIAYSAAVSGETLRRRVRPPAAASANGVFVALTRPHKRADGPTPTLDGSSSLFVRLITASAPAP